MMSKSGIWPALRHIKVGFNWLLDRVIGACDLVLMDLYAAPWPSVQRITHRLARVTGDFCWLLRDFPRISAYKLSGSELTVVFAGNRQGLLEVRAALFEDEQVVDEELGRFKIWRLKPQIQQWLDGGAHVVICELSRFYMGHMAPISFSVPLWIQQVLEIPERMEDITAGGSHTDIRKEINKARKAGFSCRFTKSREDFDHFYANMYLPYVRHRHGDSAMVTPYQDQWKRWFRKGGLVLAIDDGVPVAGLVSYLAHGTCFLIESGVSLKNPDVLKKGIKAFLQFSTMQLAHDRGCRKCDMGGSHAYRSNGPFCFKREWGARVVQRRRIYPVWRFLASNIPESVRSRLNKAGFIGEIDGKFWGIFIEDENASLNKPDLGNKLREMKKVGLGGLAVISSGKQELFSCD